MKNQVKFLLLFVLFLENNCFAQSNFLIIENVDSNYVRKHTLPNDLRLFYGAQGNSLSLGSKRDSNPDLNGNVYTNTNDYFGAGITYKWIDGDLSFSLPGTTYLKEEQSNLTQIKLGISYTLRKIAFRGYFQESKGVVISGANNQFETTPSIHETRLCLQITYLFNANRYSYRTSLYQIGISNEISRIIHDPG